MLRSSARETAKASGLSDQRLATLLSEDRAAVESELERRGIRLPGGRDAVDRRHPPRRNNLVDIYVDALLAAVGQCRGGERQEQCQ